MDLLKLLFTFSLLAFPLGEVARFQFGNGIAVTLNDVLILLTAVVWIILKRNRKAPILKPFLFFVFTLLLSLLVNFRALTIMEMAISFLYLVRFVAYSLFFYAACGFDKQFKNKIITLLEITGAITLLFGLVQYFFYSNLGNLFYMGWDNHMYRLFSSFLDPNFAGSIYVLLFIFFLGRFFSQKDKKKYFYLIATSVAAISVFITYSRSAMLLLVITAFIFLYLLKKTKTVLLLVATILGFYIFTSRFFYIESINPFRTFSTKARVDSVKTSTSVFLKNPLFGVGFDAYRYALIKYGYRKGSNALVSHADAGTDNSYLFILATSGVVGFSAFLFFIFSISKALTESLHKSLGLSRILVAVTISSCVGILVDSIFLNSLFYPFIMEWLWVLLGLSIANG